jgi:hypothetical protein
MPNISYPILLNFKIRLVIHNDDNIAISSSNFSSDFIEGITIDTVVPTQSLLGYNIIPDTRYSICNGTTLTHRAFVVVDEDGNYIQNDSTWSVGGAGIFFVQNGAVLDNPPTNIFAYYDITDEGFAKRLPNFPSSPFGNY